MDATEKRCIEILTKEVNTMVQCNVIDGMRGRYAYNWPDYKRFVQFELRKVADYVGDMAYTQNAEEDVEYEKYGTIRGRVPDGFEWLI